MPVATMRPSAAPTMPTPRIVPTPQDFTAEPDSAAQSDSAQSEPAAAKAGGAVPTMDPALMTLAGVEQELCTLAGQIAGATCRFLCLLADFDARKGWKGINVSSCAQWLSWRCGMDVRTAREHLRVARALARLPRVRDVFAAGRISYSKARAIARVGTAENEADLVAVALRAPAAHVERLTRGLRTAREDASSDSAAGAGPRAGAGEGTGDGAEEEEGSRGGNGSGDSRSDDGAPGPSPTSQPWFGARWRWDDDGSFVFWGRLSPEDGARLLAGATRAQAERLRTQDSASSEAPQSSADDKPDGHDDRDRDAGTQTMADSVDLADEAGGPAEPFAGQPAVVSCSSF